MSRVFFPLLNQPRLTYFLIIRAAEPTCQVVSFAEDLLSAAAALETQAEASEEEAKETQSLNETDLKGKMEDLRLDSTPEQ